MKKVLLIFRALLASFCLFLFFFFYFFPQKALAVAVTVTDAPSAVFTDPFDVEVKVSSGSANTMNYLRINLYKNGSTNYFGYTFNGTDWHNDSTYTNYLPIILDSNGNWSGIVKGKLDVASTFYDGSGSYGLKVRRYTAGGTYIWSNENLLTIDAATPTPTSSPSPSSTSSPTPTAQNSPALISNPIGTKVGADFTKDITTGADVLGTNSAFATPKTVKEEVKTLADSENNLSKIFIGVGVIIILASLGFYIKSEWIKQS